jgi:uncharacterized protein (DUF1800 family)
MVDLPVMRQLPRRWFTLVVILTTTVATAGEKNLSRDNALWLSRVGYGVTTATLTDYDSLGRKRYLRRQLEQPGQLPAAVTRQIDAFEISRRDAGQLLQEVFDEQKRINALPEGQPRDDARKTLSDRGNVLGNEAISREILRALYSSAPLREQLTWFWLNHFSVHQYKANVRWVVGDYVDRAIRPNELGHFSDLVLATLQHPAMLQYLDNAQNAAGHINENYARELLELHTLGVDSGYSQEDVQQLARILTGAGIANSPDKPKLKKEWEPLYRREGAFEFNPARHDFGEKKLLGHTLGGSGPGAGFDEIKQAVDIIVAQPACAKFVSRRLATYFVADEPPAALIDRMSKTFAKTHGDLRAVVEVMFDSREFTESLGKRFKDPMQFVVSNVRLAYDGKPVANTKPIINWLNSLGEPPFGRQTPDGFPLVSTAWTSSGQMIRRFEIARAIGSGNAGLFQPDNGSAAETTGFPQLSTKLYFAVIEPQLSQPTRIALDNAASQVEWNTFLLSSPDLNYH